MDDSEKEHGREMRRIFNANMDRIVKDELLKMLIEKEKDDYER